MKKKLIEMAETIIRRRSDLVEYVAQKWGKTISVWTIGRLLKSAGYVWKRMRRSCQFHRDEVLFQFFKEEIALLKASEDKGEIDLFFYDEAGFNPQPVVPYAWQKVGFTQVIASSKGPNFSVMGIISRKGDFTYQLRDKAPKAHDVIDFIDQLEIKKKTIIIMDQATTHTASAVKERIKVWKEKGLFIQLLPKASPELNIIEMLWRKIKYQWMPREAYQSIKLLKMHLKTILDHIGSDYQIHFA